MIGDDHVIRYTEVDDVVGGSGEAYSRSVGYLGVFFFQSCTTL